MRLIDEDVLLQIIDTASDDLSDRQKQVFAEIVASIPTAYDVGKIVEELEEFANLAEDRWVNGTSTHAYQEHKCWVKAIEIVKNGGVE